MLNIDRIMPATKNPGKQRELKRLCANAPFELVMPGDDLVLPAETGTTYEENAEIKAVAAALRHGIHAFGEDSGLEVWAMKGLPGVFTAFFHQLNTDTRRALIERRPTAWHDVAKQSRRVNRFRKTPGDLNQIILDYLAEEDRLCGHPVSRSACYVTHLVLVDPDGNVLMRKEARAYGTILHAPAGTGGFGQDPIMSFLEFPGRSVAELAPAEKDSVSHRGEAMRAMLRFIAGSF